MKSWGIGVVIVLFSMSFIWYHGGCWVVAKAEAERTQAKTTADLSRTMLMLSESQARAEQRITEQDAKTEAFYTQVTREHTEAATTLKQLLAILTELVESIKNDRTPPQT
jgi:hypothetical protein